MKRFFYGKLAINNIKKNYRFFIPRILAETGLLGCFFIIFTLTVDERIAALRGGDYIASCMWIGTIIVGILSFILTLYTNSCLMKQRKSEFGLYNVLGMNKKHIIRVLFFESFLSTLISIVLGIFFGILFYKLSSLLICKILQTEVILGFYFIRLSSILPPALFFFFLDAIAFLFNCISIGKLKPVELLASKNEGEREPKVKWPLFVIGLITLGAGYAIAISVEEPLSALLLFFLAVFLVIIGTYFLFVAGSIFILKLLKKTKKYYYTKKHMTEVSGLLYRMKKNSVGLASIAVLATGVLVMISTTVSLYVGMDKGFSSRYPYDLYTSVCYKDPSEEYFVPVDYEKLEPKISKLFEKYGISVTSAVSQKYLEVSFGLFPDGTTSTTIGEGKATAFVFVTEDTYNNFTGENIALNSDEILVSRITISSKKDYLTGDKITLGNMTFNIADRVIYFPIGTRLTNIAVGYGVVVKDDSVLNEIFNYQVSQYGDNASEITDRLAVKISNTDLAFKFSQEINDEWCSIASELIHENGEEIDCYITYDSSWDAYEELIGAYGSFLFLGIILGFVFIFATALIIYYKQISEGYEDRERFQILKKIGMSDKEIKKNIKDQILFVFFIPLIVSAVHMCFAFSILSKLLTILLLPDIWLFLICAIITYVLFAVVYVTIYRVTARSYYKIVR